jgi:large subunit ribosomal protein L6
MSRVGKNPVLFDSTVKITITKNNDVEIKGAKTSLVVQMKPHISAKLEGSTVVLTRKDDTQESKSLHGLYRSLINNAVQGVTKGFTKILTLQGVGYRAAVTGSKLELSLGFSHPIFFDAPKGIDIKVEKQTTVIVTGASKELVGQVAAKIRGFRPPEPYLGKGVKYSDEVIRRKEGKSAGK